MSGNYSFDLILRNGDFRTDRDSNSQFDGDVNRRDLAEFWESSSWRDRIGLARDIASDGHPIGRAVNMNRRGFRVQERSLENRLEDGSLTRQEREILEAKLDRVRTARKVCRFTSTLEGGIRGASGARCHSKRSRRSRSKDSAIGAVVGGVLGYLFG